VTGKPHRIYLVRHAKAERDHPKGDAARRLSADGRQRFEKLLAVLLPRLAVTEVHTSPYARCKETAKLLGAATGAPLVVEEALASGRSTGSELLRLARAVGDGAALVGHNPETAEAVALAAGHAVEVKPGTVAAVDLLPSGARLAWLEKPPKADS